MYDDSGYAFSRLGGTIVRLKSNGKPVTVLECHNKGGEIEVNYAFLSNGIAGQPVYLTNLDLTPVPLGWADHSRRDSAYLARMPKRSDYRQGLRQANYTSLYGANKRLISSSNLNRTILGQYMTFEGALDESSNLGKLTAFSRDFAVKPVGARSTNLTLFFKWFGPVGDIMNGLPQLSDRFDHLQESLEGAMA